MISLSNGEGSLDSLAVSDKRYHLNWFWKVLFVLCILTLCNLCCFFLQYRFGTFRTVIICELLNYSVTFFKRNKCLLFAWDVINLLRINLFMSHDFSRISQHLDNVSKSLKIFVYFFIGYPNASMWCSIQVLTGRLELWIINELEKSLFQIQIA